MLPRTSRPALLTATLVPALVSALAVTPGAVPAAGAAPAAPTGLTWGPCPVGSGAAGTADCTDIEVPRDHADPDGPTITLTMSRIPATGERRGVIAGNPGGPGGDALGMFADADAGTPEATGRIVLPPDVREHYDLVAVEPRGLTWGTPLDCPVTAAPGVTAGDLRAACESTDPGYVGTVTTDNTARDLDVARRALGEDRLNLYGVSYGGPLMATYATLFPGHTDRVLLDSSVDPGQRWFGLGATRRQARTDALNAMFTWLAERDGTYHLGTTPLQVYQRWALVVAAPYGVQLPVTPPAAQDADLPGGAAGSATLPGELALQLTDAVVHTLWRTGTVVDSTRVLLGDDSAAVGVSAGFSGMMQGIRDQNLWPVIGEQLRDPAAATAQIEAELATQPEPTAEERTAQQRMQEQMTLVERAVICNENTTAPDLSLAPQAYLTQVTGGDLVRGNEDMIASGQLCAGWDATTTPTDPSGADLDRAPLNIGYRHDATVTAAGAPGMRRAMGGELYTVDKYSHGVLLADPDALADKVSAYFA